MSSNPFEPPRTTDLDSLGTAARGAPALSAEAMAELVAAGPWVRWLARLTSASIALAIVKGVFNLGGTELGPAGRLLLLAVVMATSIPILRAQRRYAAATNRLRNGAHGTGGEVIAAQASYFKVLGVLISVALGLLALFLLLALAGALLSR
jgi:hypothetical protein